MFYKITATFYVKNINLKNEIMSNACKNKNRSRGKARVIN